VQRIFTNHSVPLFLVANPAARGFIKLRQKIKGDIRWLKISGLRMTDVVDQ
jgi:hypothetical protein